MRLSHGLSFGISAGNIAFTYAHIVAYRTALLLCAISSDWIIRGRTARGPANGSIPCVSLTRYLVDRFRFFTLLVPLRWRKK